MNVIGIWLFLHIYSVAASQMKRLLDLAIDCVCILSASQMQRHWVLAINYAYKLYQHPKLSEIHPK